MTRADKGTSVGQWPIDRRSFLRLTSAEAAPDEVFCWRWRCVFQDWRGGERLFSEADFLRRRCGPGKWRVVKTYPLARAWPMGEIGLMYVRRCYRVKDGKRHAYWALVESYRTARGPRLFRDISWVGCQFNSRANGQSKRGRQCGCR